MRFSFSKLFDYFTSPPNGGNGWNDQVLIPEGSHSVESSCLELFADGDVRSSFEARDPKPTKCGIQRGRHKARYPVALSSISLTLSRQGISSAHTQSYLTEPLFSSSCEESTLGLMRFVKKCCFTRCSWVFFISNIQIVTHFSDFPVEKLLAMSNEHFSKYKFLYST